MNNAAKPLINAVLAALSRVAGMDCGMGDEERKAMRLCLMMCVDGDSALMACADRARLADCSLTAVNDCVGRGYSQGNLARCVSGYLDFCHNTGNLETVAAEAVKMLRGMMFVDWRSQTAIDDLRERIQRNLRGAVDFVFSEVGEKWDDLRCAMRELLRFVAALVEKLRLAAFDTAEATEREARMWVADYERKLATAVEAARAEFRSKFRAMCLTSDIREVIDEIAQEQRASVFNNFLIDTNPDGSKSASKMAGVISSNRKKIAADELDEYFRYQAVFVLIDEAKEREAMTNNNNRKDMDNKDLENVFKGAHIGKLNFVNGNQYIMPNATQLVQHFHDGKERPAEQEQSEQTAADDKAEEAPKDDFEDGTETVDKLRILIDNDEIYKEAVKRLNTCERPKQINELVNKYLKANTKVPRERLRKEDVIKSFFPHLKKYKCKLDVECIQKALE